MPKVKLVVKVCDHDYVFLCNETHVPAASDNPASIAYLSLNTISTEDLV